MLKSLLTLFVLAALPHALLATSQGHPRLILIDQDGSGPGGSNQMAIMTLLPGVHFPAMNRSKFQVVPMLAP